MNEPLPRGGETRLVLTHLVQPADADFMGNTPGGPVLPHQGGRGRHRPH